MAKIIKYCWDLLCYYEGLFRYAFKRAREESDSIGGILSLIAGYVKYKHPDWGPKMENPLWMSIITVFVVFFFIRLIIAPFEKHKKQEKDLKDSQMKLDAEQEQLNQRLEPTIKKITALRRDPTIGAILKEKAVSFQIKEWGEKAKIPEDELCKNSNLYTYLSEIYLFRSCYVLILIEDEFIHTTLSNYLFCKAQHIFSSIIENYAASINLQPKIKFTPSAVVVYDKKLFGSKPLEFKHCSLDETLSKNNKEQLYPTFRVRRIEEALNNVVAYLKQKGLLKEETV